MTSSSEQGQNAWHQIEQFFALRENLKKQAEYNSPMHTIRIEEVESILYKKLVEQGKLIVYGAKHGAELAEELKEAMLHEAIAKLFATYAQFKGTARLKTYFSRIVEHLVIDHLRKISREQRRLESDEETLRRASEQRAMDAFREHGPGPEETLLHEAENILERLDFDRIGLTDKEFLAVVLKLAATCLMKKKLPDIELARRVKMKREAFVDAYLRGRNKICRYLKGDRQS